MRIGTSRTISILPLYCVSAGRADSLLFLIDPVTWSSKVSHTIFTRKVTEMRDWIAYGVRSCDAHSVVATFFHQENVLVMPS